MSVFKHLKSHSKPTLSLPVGGNVKFLFCSILIIIPYVVSRCFVSKHLVKSSTLCTRAQINKWAASSTSIIPQVPSLRKGNTDQVAIAIDMDPASSSNRLEDEDDDKGKIMN